MLLGWEHWDGSVRFNTPLHGPVPNAPVQMHPLLCSRHDSPSSTPISIIKSTRSICHATNNTIKKIVQNKICHEDLQIFLNLEEEQ